MENVTLLKLLGKSPYFKCLYQIDGEKMFPGCRVPPIVMYERKDARWALKDKHT